MFKVIEGVFLVSTILENPLGYKSDGVKGATASCWGIVSTPMGYSSDSDALGHLTIGAVVSTPLGYNSD